MSSPSLGLSLRIAQVEAARAAFGNVRALSRATEFDQAARVIIDMLARTDAPEVAALGDVAAATLVAAVLRDGTGSLPPALEEFEATSDQMERRHALDLSEASYVGTARGRIVRLLVEHITLAESALSAAFPAMWQRWLRGSTLELISGPRATDRQASVGGRTWIDGIGDELVQVSATALSYSVMSRLPSALHALHSVRRELPPALAERTYQYEQTRMRLSQDAQLRNGRGR